MVMHLRLLHLLKLKSLIDVIEFGKVTLIKSLQL